MSFLAQLYIAGLAALSLPILFHLIRRTPRGQLPFSSLMFLRPSPPRLTRRSRLENLLLLLLRATALALVAFAFARPFLRLSAYLDGTSIRGRQVIVALDTSGSMRQAGLWPKAVAEVEKVLDTIEAADRVALYAFGDRLAVLVDFNDPGEIRGDAQAAVIKTQLASVAPGWSETDLGQALVAMADVLDADRENRARDVAPQIVVVSDFQQGTRIEALQAFEWPDEVRVEARAVRANSESNAALAILTTGDDSQPDKVRVRITNEPGSTVEQFRVSWGGQAAEPALVYVPAGQSRVVQMERTDAARASSELMLEGDDHAFDNFFYTAPLTMHGAQVAYLGDDSADDPQGLHFYLSLALADDSHQAATVAAFAGNKALEDKDLADCELVVVARPIDGDTSDRLARYADRGGRVLVVLPAPADRSRDESAAVPPAATLDSTAGLFGTEPLTAEEIVPRDYAMLANLDFQHPLLAVFAGPQYNDFTRIHFWRYRRVRLPEASDLNVLARFDSGDVALVERRIGRGAAYLLTSGWQPADSQLSRSTKFVPLMLGLVFGKSLHQNPHYLAGEPIRVPTVGDERTVIALPDRNTVEVPRGTTTFGETGQPGIYRVAVDGIEAFSVAINLSPRESRTAPFDPSDLEQYGVRFGRQRSRTEELEHQRQLRDIELESRQKMWQWLSVTAIAVLILETWVAGRTARRTRQTMEPQS